MKPQDDWPPTQVRRVAFEGEMQNPWEPLASFNGAYGTRAYKVWTAVTANLVRGRRDGEVEVEGIMYQHRATPTE